MRIAAACACAFLAVLPGCKPGASKTYSRYGDAVIVTEAQWEREVGIAVVDVHREMANWIVKDDGTKSDPTYKAGSRNWKNSEAAQCSTSYLAFTTADGHTNTIRTVSIPDRDMVLILCESTDDEGAIALCNQFARVLTARGFAVAK